MKQLMFALISVLAVFVFSCQDNRPTVPVAEQNDSMSEGKTDDDIYPVDMDNGSENESEPQDSDSEENDSETDSDMENPDSDESELETVFVGLSVGSDHSCAVSEAGSVYCWGKNDNNSLGKKDVAGATIPVKLVINDKIVSVDCGNSHCYAQTSSGEYYQWGDNNYSQLGREKQYGDYNVETPEKTLIPDLNVLSLSVGADNSFVIDAKGKLYGWGKNDSGQIGDGTTEEKINPVEVDMTGVMKDSYVVSVNSGDFHTCAVDSIGKVYCWGENEGGQLGNGTTENSYVPVEVDMTGDLAGKIMAKVSVGARYSCVLDTEGTVYCWGLISDSVVSNPSKVDLENPAVSLSVSNSNACTLDEAGKIRCWSQKNPVPQAVDVSGVLKDIKIIDVQAGYSHLCALDDTGRIFCWGDNHRGQLGNGRNIVHPFSDNTPVEVVKESELENNRISFISCADEYTIATDEQGKFYFWGDYREGLGEYDFIPFLEKDDSFNEKNIIHLDSGRDYRCFLNKDGSIYCWGDNTYGQLGNNSTDSSDIPVKVNGSGDLKDKTVKMLSVGGTHSCALDETGHVFCWGNNEDGQLGNAQNINSSVPVEIDMSGILKDKTVVSVKCGSSHTCALDSEGQAYCWGNNAKRQLGDLTFIDRNIAVMVNTEVALKGKKLVLLSSGSDYNCAVDDKNAVYCWGDNGSGQLGIGYASPSYTPAKVDQSGVLKNSNIKAMFCGGESTCVLDESGKAYCWGYAPGNGSDKESSVPVEVDTAGVLNEKNLVSISIGKQQICVLDSEGQPYCWGSNSYGQLGIGVGKNTLYGGDFSAVPKKVFRSIY